MSKSKHHGGKSGRNDHDDHGSGHKSKLELLVGTNGNDILPGGSGNDLIIGRAGDDQLLGGAGNDILIGDGGTGGTHWGWSHCHWWKPNGRDNDYLDGGAGSDFILAGKGDDVANYTLSENSRAHDVYDGGKGFDTLQLTLTYAELQLASVQKDIAAFEVFLDRKANPKSDGGKTFEFKSFNLDVRNFEDLKIVLLNAPPVARNDAYALDEDSVLLVPGPGVAGNDSDLEGSTLSAVVMTGPAHGILALAADGSFSYTPGENYNGSDSFTYKVNDGDLDSNVATVLLTVAPVNDDPVAVNDAATIDEDHGVTIDVLANDSDVDAGDTLSIVAASVTSGLGSATIAGNQVEYAPGADYQYLGAGESAAVTIAYTIADSVGAESSSVVSLTVTGVNDVPTAIDDTNATDEDTPAGGNVLANDTDADASEVLTISAVDGQSSSVGVQIALASGALLEVNADGSYSYDPNGKFESMGAGQVATDAFDYVVTDSQGASANATATITVKGVNDAPVAGDDIIAGSGAGGGPIQVAVIGGPLSSFVAAAGQLNNAGDAFDLNATAIAVATFATQAEWTAALANYDVVVLGGSGSGNDYGDSPVFSALRGFVDAGGGVITTGWFAQMLPGVPNLADADYITPIAPSNYEYNRFGATITINDPTHPIAGGLSSYTVLAQLHELSPGVDAGLTPLAEGDSAAGARLAAIVYDGEVGLGRTVYLGSLHLAQDVPGYDPAGTRSGAADQIFKQAVTWAAGEPDSSATTDEDTVHIIDDAALLANDTDVEGDALSILSVSATSAHGAAVSINADGNIVYDPTIGLQYLDDGEVVTDSFTYTVSDGNGGTGTATVSLTVSGADDAPQAQFDASSTGADTVIVGNVLANDYDPEGDPFTLLTTGPLTTAYGASVVLESNGTFTYNPTGSAALQALAAGVSVVDTFEYTISDAKGSTSTATASFTVAGNAGAGGGGSGKLLDSVPAGTDLEYYIRFEDSSPEWLRLEGFNMALSNSGSVGSGGGGAGAGKATGLDISTVLGSSQTLVQLTEALATGKHLKGVEIEAYVPGGDKGGNLIDQYYFEDVLVTSLNTGGSASSTANHLGFDYARFNHGHVDYKDTGTVEQITEAGWDFVLNKSATGAGPGIAGDALKADLDDALPLDMSLKYYVTYEGADGWLELDSFSMALSNNGSIGSGGGAGAGKLSATGAFLGLGSSAQLLELTQALTSGKHYKDLEVEAYRSGGDKGDSLVDQYYFQDVLVSSLSTSNASSNQVSVDFGAFSHGHIDYKDDGTQGDVTEAGWSFIQNKDFSVPVDADFGGKDIPLDSVPAGTDLEYYIRFEDSSPEWLRLEGFNMALSNSGSVGSGGGGAGAGKATGLDISTVLGSSQTLVQLTEALATGKHLKGVEIEAYVPGGDKGGNLIDQYYFEDVLVTSLNTGGSASSTANHLGFDYARFNHGHVDYKDTGTVEQITEAGWDFVLNKSATGAGPGIAGDALKADLDDALPLDMSLKYYVTYEGADGWLELDSFSMALSNNGSIGSGGGAGAGKLSATGAFLGLGSSAQLLELTQALTSGKHYKDLEVEAYRSGGDKGDSLVDQYYFQDVLVSSLSTSNASSNQVSVDFGAFSHGHIDYKDDGTQGDVTEAGWSFIQNKDFSVPVDADFGGKDIPLDSVPAGTDLEYYIRFEDSSPEWLRLEGFNMALSNSGSVGSGGGGAGAGKATGLDISTVLGSSQTLVQLTEALATGKHLKGVEIEAYVPGGDKGGNLIDQYYFEDVLVTSLNTGGSASSTANHLGFDYARFNHGHVDYKDTGTVEQITEAGWDFVLNKSATGAGPGIAGDALKADLDDALPLDMSLKYYVTYEGADGWLELDSFSMALSNNGSIGSGGGAGAGKLSATGAFLGLGSSAQLLELTQALTSGKHYKDLEVEAYRSGGDKGDSLVDQYYFQDVLVSSLSTSNASSNQVSVDFGAFSHGHIDYKDDGTQGDVTEAGWSFIQNKDFSVPVDADLF